MISQIVASELSFSFTASFPEFNRKEILEILMGMSEPSEWRDWNAMGEPSQESYIYWENNNLVCYTLEVGEKIWTEKTNWALCRYEYTSETLWEVKEFKSWEL